MALAQLAGLGIGLLMARNMRRAEEVAPPTPADRRATSVGFMAGSLLLIAVSAALIWMRTRYTPFFLGAMCVAALLYFPLSAANVDEDDDRPVPYRDAAKLTFIGCTVFANLSGLAVHLWLRHAA